MRVRTLEIRWHDAKPIYACDFQPSPVKRPRASTTSAQSYRLATGGGDNNIRIWMVHPNFIPPGAVASVTPIVPPPPRVEYLATLSKHSAAVNVVRFSPNGELIASAGDDGIIIIWAPSDRPTTVYGNDTPEEQQYEKEHWRVRTSLRCASCEVYDLAWSPTGEYIISGSTDNTARIFNVTDGICVREIAEHNHYVQGVAWDPMNEFIATQSSDRSVHVYSISTKHGLFEAHAVGKNSRMAVRHSRTPSTSVSTSTKPASMRRSSNATSDTESAIVTNDTRDDSSVLATPLTPAASVTSASSAALFVPPKDRSTSRRSSLSSNAAGSPPHYSHFGRSPSPMPPLPAIRAPPATAAWAAVKLYGDETVSNFFRRLTFSPDGALLLTPAGQFEDPSVVPSNSRASSSKPDDPPVRPKKSASTAEESSTSSSVYIYSRASFARPPVAHLPGHKKASVAVKFSPMLYDLRPNVLGAVDSNSSEVKKISLEKGKDYNIQLDLESSTSSSQSNLEKPAEKSGPSSAASSPNKPSQPLPTPSSATLPSPSASNSEFQPPTTPSTGSVFALPYRMMFAVATQDTVMIYDTQQAGPICMMAKLHYDSFTDMAWSHDGQVLMLASSDGYCTVVVFDEQLPLHHTQQHNLQLQSIALSHAHSLISPQQHQSPSSFVPPSPPVNNSSSLQPATPLRQRTPLKRASTPVTTAEETGTSSLAIEKEPEHQAEREPAKKKRRVALTHHGGLDT